MKRSLVLLLLAACGTPSRRDADPAKEALDAYRGGDFERSERELDKILAREPENLLALRMKGRVLLYRNRLRESVDSLRQALQLMDRQAKDNPRRAVELQQDWYLTCQDLANATYRMDDFAAAAEAYLALGEELLAAKYAALAKDIAYVVRWEDEPSVIPFVSRDPIPLVPLRINGIRGVFAIDTGSGEMVLDPRFVVKAQAKVVGIRTENYVGPVQEGTVQEVTLGSVTVRNVPVRIRRIADQEIDGILGANFLLHFTFTIDYRKERLVLRRLASGAARAGVEVPLLIVGDRFLVTQGTLDGKGCFLFLNSGLTRVAVSPSQGMLWTLSNKLETASFGPVTLNKPVFDSAPFPTGLDTNFGFTIGAAVGHEAFKGRALTFEPERGKLTIE